ncbi:hypothetical protein G6F58_013830 [Rhizopus delemar]|nr:hypothetical protein G6F58_013830 [Rhizopus delemar]
MTGLVAAARTSWGSTWPIWKLSSARAKAALPASVSATPRPAGLSSWWPRFFSSSRTWALMVWMAMSSRSAAREKPPSLATIQK